MCVLIPFSLPSLRKQSRHRLENFLDKVSVVYFWVRSETYACHSKVVVRSSLMSPILFGIFILFFSQFTVYKERCQTVSCPLLTVCPFGDKKKCNLCAGEKIYIKNDISYPVSECSMTTTQGSNSRLSFKKIFNRSWHVASFLSLQREWRNVCFMA